MMLIQLEDFGAFGLVMDELPHNLPPEIFSYARNVRFVDGAIQKFSGHSEIYEPPLDDPIFIMPWTTPGNRRWIYASATAIYRITGQTHVLVSDPSVSFNASMDNP